ncbi:unnamed protein product, partial [Ascophyllum nodosum]
SSSSHHFSGRTVRRKRANGKYVLLSSSPTRKSSIQHGRGPASISDILRRKEGEIKEKLSPETNLTDMDQLMNEILAESKKVFGSRGGSQGAEGREFTCVATVEAAPQFKCPIYGRNTDQSKFIMDPKQGDTICLGANGQGYGTVVQNHKDAGKLRKLAEDVEMGLRYHRKGRAQRARRVQGPDEEGVARPHQSHLGEL